MYELLYVVAIHCNELYAMQIMQAKLLNGLRWEELTAERLKWRLCRGHWLATKQH
jgi:hypothetical protein